jgi:hypothetical protein
MSNELSCIGGEFAKALLNAIDNHPFPPRISISNTAVYASAEGRTVTGKPILVQANFYLARHSKHQTNTVETGASIALGKAQVGTSAETKGNLAHRAEPQHVKVGEGADLAEALAAVDKMRSALEAAPARCGLD